MGIFDKFKTSTAIDRLSEEKLYEQVAQELKAGKKREGIWVKATAKSGGDLNKAESMYIELRVQAIKDEDIVNVELEDRAKAIAAKARIDKEASDRVTREKEEEKERKRERENNLAKAKKCLEVIRSKGYKVTILNNIEEWNVNYWYFYIYKKQKGRFFKVSVKRHLNLKELCEFADMAKTVTND